MHGILEGAGYELLFWYAARCGLLRFVSSLVVRVGTCCFVDSSLIPEVISLLRSFQNGDFLRYQVSVYSSQLISQ
jgi:hypothetical protein